MKRIFVEVYPYHSETLFPYADAYGSRDDYLLYNLNSHGRDILATLEMNRLGFSLRKLLQILWREKISEVHINSISLNLHGRSWAPWRKAFAILLIPYLSRLFGARVFGIAHEADQYFATPTSLNRRHYFYQKWIGRFHKRLFCKIFVLAPEIKNYIEQYGGKVSVMSTRSLIKLNKVQVAEKSGLTLAWIGAMDNQRRSWGALYTLLPSLAEKGVVRFDMICDMRAAAGPEFESKIDDLGIRSLFKLRHYRPDDDELFASVQAADIVVGFYAQDSYGKVKTSGARHIALAYDKPVLIEEDELFKIIDSAGRVTLQSSDLSVLLQELQSAYIASPEPPSEAKAS